MKRFLLLLFLFSGHLVSGQFSIGDSISKITFQYSRGHNSFGSPGLYAISEVIEFSKTDGFVYTISKFIQIRNSYDSLLNTVKADTLKIAFKKIDVSSSTVNKLIIELNSYRENFNNAYIKRFFTKPTKKEIYATAASHGLKWKFENEYSDRQDRREVLHEIRRYYLLDSFLNIIKPRQHSDLIISIDAWHLLAITTISKNNIVEYRCDFSGLPAQPILRYDNGDYIKYKMVYNLQANESVKSFVPPNSLIHKAVDIKNIEERYIKWYLDKFL